MGNKHPPILSEGVTINVFVHKQKFKWFLPLGLFEEIYIKEMDAGVKKYQGQVFASQQSFDSNIKSLFPHRIPRFFILFILKWEKFLADIYVWTSDGASIIHMLFLKSWKGKYLTSKHVSFWNSKVWCLKVAWIRQLGRGQNLRQIIQSKVRQNSTKKENLLNLIASILSFNRF